MFLGEVQNKKPDETKSSGEFYGGSSFQIISP